VAGTGFDGYGCGLSWKTPGLPVTFPSGKNNAEDFADRIGHKFFLIYGPWVHFGRNFFSIALDEDYDSKDRFIDDDSMAQAQLREIIELIQERYTEGVLRQSWFSRTVSSFFLTTMDSAPSH